MEKNWIVFLSRFIDDGIESSRCSLGEIHYGPYSREEAELIASELNRKILEGEGGAVQIEVSAIELKLKTFEEILQEGKI